MADNFFTPEQLNKLNDNPLITGEGYDWSKFTLAGGYDVGANPSGGNRGNRTSAYEDIAYPNASADRARFSEWQKAQHALRGPHETPRG